MSIIITDSCINCGACEPECPNNAIYEGGTNWKFSEGTNLKGNIVTSSGFETNSDSEQLPLQEDYYFIVSDKCTECKGFYNEPQCAAVCPVDCCIPDDSKKETEQQLLSKKDFLHS